jgi:hypothetical protein
MKSTPRLHASLGFAGSVSATLAILATPVTASPKFTALYTFSAGSAGGYWPSGELVMDPGGALYGTTEAGGKACPSGEYSCGGTVYRLSPPSSGTLWKLTVLYSFKGGVDGAAPVAGVIVRPDNGVIHGTTLYGGNTACTSEPHHWGCGTVFELRPPFPGHPGWTRQVIHRFGDPPSARLPKTRLLEFSDGSVVGNTDQGGKFDDGEAFSLVPTQATAATSLGATVPQFSLRPIIDLAGSTDGRSLINMFEFYNRYWYKERLQAGAAKASVAPSGYTPTKLFGAAKYDGDSNCVDAPTGCGTIFEVDEPTGGQTSWSHKVLFSFLGGNGGAFPNDGGLIGPNSVLYGTAMGGNACTISSSLGCGIVYRLMPPGGISSSWKYEVVYRFKGGRDGASPSGHLGFDATGNVYGVTQFGGGCSVDTRGCGIIYKLAPPTPPATAWTETVLYRFQGGSDGKQPTSGVLLKKAVLYGVNQSTVYSFQVP